MKNITNIFIASLFVLGFAACNEQLDIEKHGNLGAVEDFYKTDGEVEQACAAMYAAWKSNCNTEFYTKNVLSDDVIAAGGKRADNGNMERLNEYTFGSDNGNVESLYSGYYTLIYYANLILTNVEPNTPFMRQAIAEAKVARGYAHLMLGIYYGTAPVVDHLLTGEDVRQPNGTREKLYGQAIKDLDDAIASGDLSAKSSVSDKSANNRLTLGAAQALLGKTYLFAGDKEKAAAALKPLIESNTYDLVAVADYDKLLHYEQNNGIENVIEFQKRKDVDNVEMSFYEIMQYWRVLDGVLSITPGSQADGVIAAGGYGFCNPTADLYKAFEDMDKAAGLSSPDARFLASVRSYEQIKAYGVELGSSTIYGNQGYFFWKNRPLTADLTTQFDAFQVFQCVNHHVMRYAEVLLIAAEANVDLDNAKATAYVNKIRTRAGLPPLASVTLEDIQKEKRLELCLEGTRWEDMVRWNLAEEKQKDQGQYIYFYSETKGVTTENQTQTSYGFRAKHKLLPIPMKELNVNKKMEQNEGWK